MLTNPVLSRGAPAIRFEGELRAGGGPYAIIAPDLNRDGFADLVVADSLDDTVSVLLGRGGGSFQQPAVPFPVGLGPADFAVGNLLAVEDVNLDRVPDIIVANPRINEVSLLAGLGNGDFAPRMTVLSRLANGTTGGIALHDVDGDGRPDLAVADRNADTVTLLFGDWPAGNGQSSTFATPAEPVAVAIGDLNRDGRPDLAVANRTAHNVSIFTGAGRGRFAPRVDFPLGNCGVPEQSAPRSIRMADATGDGRFDVLVADERCDEVAVLAGDGEGNLDPPLRLFVGGGPMDALACDLNGDNLPDVVTVNSFTDNVSALAGRGNGDFGNAVTFEVGITPFGIAIADFNGDGKPDVVTANLDTDNLSLLLNSTAFEVLPGDADIDGQRTATDTALLLAELFDGDGEKALDTRGGYLFLGAAADANGDTRINAADLVAVARLAGP